jgi:hypothetical protein
MYICQAGIFPSARTALACPQYVTSCRILPPKALLPEFPAHDVHLKQKKKPRKRVQNTALCGI